MAKLITGALTGALVVAFLGGCSQQHPPTPVTQATAAESADEFAARVNKELGALALEVAAAGFTQDTFIRVHRNLGQFRGESALEAWVYGITRRVGLQRRRKSNRRKWLSESVIPGLDNVYNTDPGGRVDRQRIAGYIRHFFTELPPRQREVFDLVDLQGHEPAEVAEMLGLKQATLRANLFKARAAIRANIIAAHPAAGEIDR